MNNEELDMIAKNVASKYDYDECKAHFCRFADLKIKWTRSYNWIDFRVPDYLNTAPAEVIEKILDFMMGKITRRSVAYCYPKEVSDRGGAHGRKAEGGPERDVRHGTLKIKGVSPIPFPPDTADRDNTADHIV